MSVDTEEHLILTKPVRPAKPVGCPTRAQRRAISKGGNKNGIKMSGAFGKRPSRTARQEDGGEYDSLFDAEMVIKRCIARGWMTPGEAFGVYHATDRGLAAVRALDDYREAKESYGADMKAWRAAQARFDKAKAVEQPQVAHA